MKVKKYILKSQFFGDREYPNKISAVIDVLSITGFVIVLIWLASKLP